ncbi:ergothioneine biosynthesis glutamate--cysteine ligase EgtA [Rhodococcus ruber]|uniref:ergothioneine biosynthesis glutamate--cysteine ligase EgtA n=1 Tax=Rhodococcus TaxID=1827 RepID=UPI00029A7BE5|nr:MULTISPECIES: ergothioneine biosynthesis glutamate--cysteine ligase EgtA [Rhodococcus]RIK11578.1 MAG: ergothioneine biosynthesis glutamate--cysteine ligase EgtA [Acidobacteriota bacterium]ATQ31209.1 ergothioneine biosynthesis glutamate--cysteine ligase EgtA [Rhodococcus ruber]MCZ1070726.1 ergothioneine biosynthesis glutamate--cysteine ligase EgtA [Rhodococcus sp. A5(2022)]MDV3206094.1 ergothioneine biosynthesis glutamate--cysteine ligase EgtA [Rhodococcus ruber]RQM34901.1 ergothioneine bios
MVITVDPAVPRADAGIASRTAAELHVRRVSFRFGPPRLIGVELEWLTARADGTRARPELQAILEALGPHAPRQLAPGSSARPLPSGSAVTLEPGGQVELSSVPCVSARQVCDRLTADARMLGALLARRSVDLIDAAADGLRPPQRLLRTPRYSAMELRFDRIGPLGRLMMNSTAATQVSVDAGADDDELARRWRVLHAVGPALVAAFACSPSLRGAPDGNWASQRMRTWLALDADRTTPVPDPARYPAWALDAPLLCVRATGGDWHAPPGASFADWLGGDLDDEIGRRPTVADLDYHLTTLFPPVRPAGHLEVRYIDAQPGALWQVPVAAVEALLTSPAVMDEALAVAAPVVDRWQEAAEFGLADLEIRAAAVGLLALAAEASPDMRFTAALDAAAERCCRGRTPEVQDR